MDGEETFLLLSNRRDREPNSGVKGSGANHYPRAPALLSEKHCPICLRLHDKTFGNQKSPRGRAPRPLYSKIFFMSNFTPPPSLKSWIRPCINSITITTTTPHHNTITIITTTKEIIIILAGVTCGFVTPMERIPVNSYSCQLVPMSARTHVNSYPCQLVPRIDVNSYHK